MKKGVLWKRSWTTFLTGTGAIATLFALSACVSPSGAPVSWGHSGGEVVSRERFGQPDFSVVEGKVGMTEVGRASWYGPTFYGKRTASGSIFRKHALTAAHRTLPLGSTVRVTNLANGRSVDVLINDRGPFVSGRIIDLSWEAANRLEIIGPGTGLVKLTVLSVPGGRGTGPESHYSIQVASFSSYDKALSYRKKLRGYDHIRIQRAHFGGQPIFRVQVGHFTDPQRARSVAREVKANLGSAFIVEVD